MANVFVLKLYIMLFAAVPSVNDAGVYEEKEVMIATTTKSECLMARNNLLSEYNKYYSKSDMKIYTVLNCEKFTSNK